MSDYDYDDTKEPPSPRSGDFGSIEDRMRVPTKGLRLRLRTHLRALGVTGKFRTDELRRGRSLVVLFQDKIVELPIKEFEGRKVVARLRKQTHKQYLTAKQASDISLPEK